MAETLAQYVQLIRDQVQQGMVELFAAENPLVGELHFINVGERMGYEFNREATLGGVGSRALNAEFPDAAKTSGTSVPIKEGTGIVGGDVLTDIQLLGTRATRIAQKMKALSGYLGKLLLKGDTATDATAFDGIYKRCTGLATVVYAGANGGYMDLAVLDRMILRVPGAPSQKRLVMGVDMQILLGAVLKAQGATKIGLAEWANGTTPTAYSGVKIVDPGEDENRDLIMQFNEKRGNSSVTGSIVCARFGGPVDGEHCQGLAKVLPSGNLFDVRMQGERGSLDQVHIEGRFGMSAFHDRCIQQYAGLLNAVSAPAG